MLARLVSAVRHVVARALLAVPFLAWVGSPAMAQECDWFGEPYGGTCGEIHHFTQLGSVYRTNCTTDHSEGIIDSYPALGLLHLQSWSSINFNVGFTASLRLEGAPPGVTLRKIRLRFARTSESPTVGMTVDFFNENIIQTFSWDALQERDSMDVGVVPAADGNVTFSAGFQLGGDGLDATLSYEAADIPPGARVVGCYGYVQEGPPLPTPTRPLSWGRVKAACR